MPRFRFDMKLRPAAPRPITRRRAAAMFLLLSLLLAGGGSPVVASPTTAEESEDSDFNEDRDDSHDEASLDSLTVDQARGIRDLGRHYILGGTTPIPAREPIEFLLLRVRHGAPAPLRDAALGSVASFSSLLLNDYLKWGMPDSTGLVPVGHSIKSASDQAMLVSLLTLGLRESGKDIFRRKAGDAARDLAAWCVSPDGSFHAWVANAPEDTTRGGDDPVARWRVLAALTEAAASIPDLFPAGGLESLQQRLALPRVELTPDQQADPATLLAAHDAAMMAGDPAAAGWLPSLASRIAERTAIPAGASPGDDARTGLAAWALARYGFWAHDDAARRAAWKLVDGLHLRDLRPVRRIDLFAGRGAAALALEFLTRPAPMAYIVGNPQSEATRALARAAMAASRPGRLLAVRPPDDPHLLYPPAGDGTSLAYVCSGDLCAPPTSSPDEVRSLLQTFALPGAESLLPGFGR